MFFFYLFIFELVCSSQLWSSPVSGDMTYLTTDYKGVASNGSTVLSYGTHGIILRSTDKGASWFRTSIGNDNDVIRIDTINSSYVALTRSGLLRSDDNASTWTRTAIENGVDMCRDKDTIYVLTKYAIVRTTFSRMADISTLVSMDSTVSARSIVASARGSLHWIEDNRYVRHYSLSSKTSTATDVLSLNQCPTCYRIDGLQQNMGKLYVAIVNTRNNPVGALPFEFYQVYMSPNLGSSWQRYSAVDSFDENTLGTANFKVVSDSQIIALRTKVLPQSVYIPAPDTLNRKLHQWFVGIEYLSFNNSGTSSIINPDDTIPERYALSSDLRLNSLLDLGNGIIVANGNNHCIVRSTDNGRSWQLQSYFPNDAVYSTPFFRGVDSNHLYMPCAQGAFYRTDNAGLTILPQRFQFYPQYLAKGAGVVFSHYDSSGHGCVIIQAGLELDSNVFITNDFGETYSPVGVLPLFNVFASDSVQRTKYRLTNIMIRNEVETDTVFLLAGTPTYVDANNTLQRYPYSVVIRLNKQYGLIDTVALPVSKVAMLIRAGRLVYLFGTNGEDLSYKRNVADLVFPTYAMYRSIDDGRTWESVSTSLPIPNEYVKVGQQYAAVVPDFRPAIVFDSTLVVSTGQRRLLIYSKDKMRPDSLHLPFDQNLLYLGETMISSDNALAIASIDGKLFSTALIEDDKTVWDSSPLQSGLSWDGPRLRLQRFIPVSDNTGFTVTGEYKDTDRKYKTHLLRYSLNIPISDVKEDVRTLRLWESLPYPQPARHTVMTRIYWGKPCSLQDLEISLFDFVGILVDGDTHSSRIAITAVDEISASLAVDCNGLTPGVYFIRVRLRNSDRTIPFVVQ